ncbi:hypothetical protein [Saccharomonospora sp. NB11]|jgi:hypothetical protein|nr:hypothetical protein [Saccharomonospora sp. NB11]
MSRPTRTEQRRARRALIVQAVLVLTALVVVSLTGRGRHTPPRDDR